MKPGIVWIVLNFCDSFATFVESAEPGRNEELSFFWTSASLPWKRAAGNADEQDDEGERAEDPDDRERGRFGGLGCPVGAGVRRCGSCIGPPGRARQAIGAG